MSDRGELRCPTMMERMWGLLMLREQERYIRSAAGLGVLLRYLKNAALLAALIFAMTVVFLAGSYRERG